MTPEQLAAMEQALEKVQEFKARWWKVPPFGNKVNKATREAITNAHSPIFELENTIREALAEQPAQQEPVATVQDLDEVKRKHLVYELGFDWKDPLYTSPPASKPWVGLTDEEIEKLAVENGHATFLNDDEETGIIWFDGDATPFARAIEQKLREKNGGAA